MNTDPLAPLIVAAQRDANNPDAWRKLADACFAAGRAAEADAAYQRHIATSVNDPTLRKAALALAANRLDVAERLIKPHLKNHPTDVAAIRLLAELAGRLGRLDDAEGLLLRALELAPGFGAARLNLAMLHLRRQRFAEALEEVAALLTEAPTNPAYLNLEGVALARIGDYADAATRFGEVLKARPHQPRVWLSYGHSLKTVGQQAEAIAAYRRAIELEPSLGDAWWSLANLKAIRFTAGEIAAMAAALDHAGLSDDDALHLHFALGKAREDTGEFAAALTNYASGNSIRARQLAYDPAPVEALVAAGREVLTPGFFTERADWGEPAADPIFILGMPRSGSTLVEQILSSHSAIEGTRELPDIEMLARKLGPTDARHITALAAQSREALTAMGAQYLAATKVYRKTAAPLFIDKMPNNWAYIPLIKLILPNARIIDTRRGAMACCFSNFKQHYARGQAFSYRLDHMARYYRAYVAQMDHLDQILPGAVYRVSHEAMVADTDSEITKLLAWLNLPLEPACLRFWETERAVQTASSEQVRQRIFSDGLDQWRNFAPWLDELREGLGELSQA